ncbi:ATP synthase F1 subunit gamma [Alkaliphilus hydrothermalis]|uniref:ATP synthase F1 subunit gamma n=1 Tax=Alkaliphilus hydrothermalis TaxID=1482730 RepID=UPI002FE6E0B7
MRFLGLGMRDIKRRIKSVNSTKQITKAMELVSSAKLRKAKEELEKTKPYFNAMEDTIRGIFANTKGIKHEFLTQRDVKKTAYIVITADRGLCGGYNSNVIKLANSHMAEKQNKSIIAVGARGRDFFKKRDFDFDGEYTQLSETPSFSTAQQISRLALELYKQGLVDEVNLVYTQFISTINQKPTVKRILPLEISAEEGSKGSKTMIAYEPSPEAVLDYLVPKYVDGMVFGALVESATSEQAARRVAMESATDNAEEMIGNLKLVYNRARQASITQEIAEIVGGAEALK